MSVNLVSDPSLERFHKAADIILGRPLRNVTDYEPVNRAPATTHHAVLIVAGPYGPYFFGQLQYRDEETSEWKDHDDGEGSPIYVLAIGYMDEALTVGERYHGTLVDVNDAFEYAVYACTSGGAGGDLHSITAYYNSQFISPSERVAIRWGSGGEDRINIDVEGRYACGFNFLLQDSGATLPPNGYFQVEILHWFGTFLNPGRRFTFLNGPLTVTASLSHIMDAQAGDYLQVYFNNFTTRGVNLSSFYTDNNPEKQFWAARTGPRVIGG